MKPRNPALFRFNPITGYWQRIKTVDPDRAADWLRVFREDEPSCYFVVAHRRPNASPVPR
jgi:hypothetical protein